MLAADHQPADHLAGTANDPASTVAADVFETDALASRRDDAARMIRARLYSSSRRRE